jgi:hypothetical protein
MLKILIVLALGALAFVLVRALRSRPVGAHGGAGSEARAAKLAAEQAVIARQGGQGAGQGGVGGGMGF